MGSKSKRIGEAELRLVAMILITVIAVVNAVSWHEDHSFLLFVGWLIGLLAGVKLKPPSEGGNDLEAG